MKKLLLPVILILLIGGGGYAYYVYSQPDEKPQIIQLAVSKGNITEVVVATGTLDALRTVVIGSQVSGVVQDLYVDFNYMVKEGQVLARIDPLLLQSAVDQADANFQKAGVDLERMKVQLEQNVLDQKRAEDLFQKNLVTQQALEQARLTVKTQASSIASSEKGLVQIQANLEQAKTNLSYATIKSPIDGVVVSRSVDKGSTVQASTTTPQFFLLATDLTKMKLTGGVDESDIGKIHPGQTATFTVEAYMTPQQTFTGLVNSVRLNAQTQNNVVTYQVICDVVNPDLKLRPGMTASIKIEINKADNVTRIPNSALRFRPSKDMYAALGIAQPTGGAGGGGRGAAAPGQMGQAAPGAAPAAGAPATTPATQDQVAQNKAGGAAGGTQAPSGGRQGGAQFGQGQGGGNRQPGQGGGNRQPGQGGGGRGGNFASSLTPAQQKQWADIQKLPRDQQMAAMQKAGISFGGGRGGAGGGGGRGNRGAANAVQGPVMTATQHAAEAGVDTIDKLYLALPRAEGRSQVWIATEDPTTKKVDLKSISLRTGITDGQWTELITGDIQPGTEVVTGIILPVVKTSTTSTNPLMQQQQQRGGPGGMPGGRGGGGGGGRGGL